MLSYTGTVINVQSFASKPDPKTGEIIPEKHLVQFLGKKPGPDGVLLADLEDLKVEDPKPFLAAKGKQVRVMVRHWTYEGRSGLSIPKSSPVEVLA
ncbi:MAG: hypothetical protein ACYCSN_18345 [Acidobacteriaceae bacterium]